MGPDLFSNIELRNTYQSENNFVSNIRNFSGLNVLSLNIKSLLSKFEKLKKILDRIEQSGGNVSVLVWQEIREVSIPNFFFKISNENHQKKHPKLIPGLVRQNTFTFESILIEIQL